MVVIFILVLLSSTLIIKGIDADVVILNTTNQAFCECGQILLLSCKCTEKAATTVWKNANDILPIAICRNNFCTMNPSYDDRQYNISFDKNRCIFNLTVLKVTMKDNGRKLVCSDGSHTDSKIISVRDYSLDVIEDRDFGTITATSGCVSQDTEVSFKWMKMDACTSIENQFFPKVHFKNTTRCSNDSVCGNDQHLQYIEEVLFNPSGHRNHHLKVTAVYRNGRKDFSNEIALKHVILKGEKLSCYPPDKPFSLWIICITSIGIIPICLLSIIWYTNERNRDEKCCETCLNIISFDRESCHEIDAYMPIKLQGAEENKGQDKKKI